MANLESKKIYVAIPYTGYHEKSFELANQVSYQLIKMGHIPFSPISMSHPIVEQSKKDFEFDKQLLGTWDVWSKIDYAFIDWCDTLLIVNFNDKAIMESTGVNGELDYAKSQGKEILMRNIKTLEDVKKLKL